MAKHLEIMLNKDHLKESETFSLKKHRRNTVAGF